MYNDRNEELERLENELLRAEMTDDDFEAFYNEICDELEDSSENRTYDSEWDIQPSETESRRYQTGWEADFGGELDEEPPKEKSIRGLVVCACFECLAIAAIMLWWVFRIL